MIYIIYIIAIVHCSTAESTYSTQYHQIKEKRVYDILCDIRNKVKKNVKKNKSGVLYNKISLKFQSTRCRRRHK